MVSSIRARVSIQNIEIMYEKLCQFISKNEKKLLFFNKYLQFVNLLTWVLRQHAIFNRMKVKSRYLKTLVLLNYCFLVHWVVPPYLLYFMCLCTWNLCFLFYVIIKPELKASTIEEGLIFFFLSRTNYIN